MARWSIFVGLFIAHMITLLFIRTASDEWALPVIFLAACLSGLVAVQASVIAGKDNEQSA